MDDTVHVVDTVASAEDTERNRIVSVQPAVNMDQSTRRRRTVRNRNRNKRRRTKPAVPANNDKENLKQKGAIELAIERINALQQALAVDTDDEDLSDDDDDDTDDEFDPDFASLLLTFDARALGYMACAKEAIQYLTDRGVPRDNPMMVNLRNRLIQGINNM